MSTTVRRGAVVLLLVLSAACGRSVPTAPGTIPPPAAPLPTPPPTGLPPLSGPSRTFIFDHELSYSVSQHTKESRFVLYDNGAFALQYVSLGVDGFEYRGSYTEADGVVAFAFGWADWSPAGPFDATGTVKGHSLTVQYTPNMQMADFEDAVYKQMP